MIPLVASSLWTFLLKFSPLLSSIIVILVFILSQVIASQSRKYELRRSWYFKAYLDKSIDKVNDFFNDSRKITKKALKKVSEIKDTDSITTYVSSKLEIISDLQRDFIYQVLSPLKGAYPKVFRDIVTLLDNFYDVHSSAFDKQQDTSIDSFKLYLEKTEEIRNNIMLFLAIPVLNNRQSKSLRSKLAEQNGLSPKYNAGKFFILFLIFIIITLGITQYCKRHNLGKGSHLNTEMAVYHAKQAVLLKLLSPSTAEFDNKIIENVKRLSDSTFQINSYVDSQNRFGAVTRSRFSCLVILSPNKNKCMVKNFTIVYY